jgi:uncharacterized protein (UPF0218 family)
LDLFFTLPIGLRPFLKNPYGTLYSGNDPSHIKNINIPADAVIIAVGDVTTYNLFKAGFMPRLCLIDRITKRSAVSAAILDVISRTDYINVPAKNPAGVISSDMVLCIKKALEMPHKHICINVDGEEDLATLPVIAFSKPGTLVLYGQPDEGVVCVTVTEEKKKEMRDMLLQTFTAENAKMMENGVLVSFEYDESFVSEVEIFVETIF